MTKSAFALTPTTVLQFYYSRDSKAESLAGDGAGGSNGGHEELLHKPPDLDASSSALSSELPELTPARATSMGLVH